ncbi:hypothetical protein TB1_046176 [Malus domestica]
MTSCLNMRSKKTAGVAMPLDRIHEIKEMERFCNVQAVAETVEVRLAYTYGVRPRVSVTWPLSVPPGLTMLDRMRTKEGAGNQKSMKMLMDKAIIKHLTVVVIKSVDSSFEDYKYKLESLCLH